MALKLMCLECGEPFEVEEWELEEYEPECPHCGSVDIDLNYNDGKGF